MTTKRWALRFAAALTLLVAAGAAPASAQQSIIDYWVGKMEKAEKDLAEGRYAPVEKSMNEIIPQMIPSLLADQGSRDMLALATAFQASAEIGLGKRDDGLWHWGIAQNLQPAFRRARLSRLGEPGQVLAEERLRLAGELPAGAIAPGEPSTDPLAVIRAPGPKISSPYGINLAPGWTLDPVAVEVAVRADGTPFAPVATSGTSPGRIYLALEAVRAWRFSPLGEGDGPHARLREIGDIWASRDPDVRLSRVPGVDTVHANLLSQRLELADQELVALERAHRARWGRSPVPGESFLPPSEDLLLMRALVDSALDRPENAAWSLWTMASLSFHEPTRGLAVYGEAGRRLLEVPWDCLDDEAACSAQRIVGTSLAAGTSPPKILKATPLATQPHQRATVATDLVQICLTVDRHGSPQQPLVCGGRDTVSGQLALEAVRQWRFEPATLDGEPIDSRVRVTVPTGMDGDSRAAWTRELDQLAEKIESLELAAAGELAGEASRLVDRIASATSEPTAGGADLLARGILLLALTEAAAGDSPAALWHRSIAVGLAAELDWLDLDRYGVAGHELGRLAAAHAADSAAAVKAADGETRIASSAAEAPAPRPRDRHAEPTWALASVLTDPSGRPQVARLLAAKIAPGAAWPSLDKLREWRYEPVERTGTATAAWHRQQLRLSPGQPFSRLRKSLSATAKTLAIDARREARSGNATLASCYWNSAAHLDPRLFSVSAVGEPPELQRLIAETGLGPIRWLAIPRERRDAVELTSEITPPRKIKAPPPSYTERTRKQRVQGNIVAQAVIDSAGHVTEVEILKGLHPDLDFNTLRPLCSWQFEPAKLDGEDVAVYYNLTVNFTLQ